MKLPAYERMINSELIELFKERFFESDWYEIEIYENLDETYKTFPHKFLAIYGSFFPKKKIRVKTANVQSPWMIKGIKKSLKHKHAYMRSFWKKRNQGNELEYENYKILFEGVKKSFIEITFL